MKQSINWQTGVPTKEGTYLLTMKDGNTAVKSFFLKVDREFFEDSVVAWCHITDIEPYKEETKPKKKCCGECKFYRKAELDPIMAKYDFDGVCIAEPPTLGTNSQTVPCHLFKSITD